MDTPALNLRITLRQLVYFVAAAETGSVKLAAERVHISQPSISAAIAHLEQELGLQLFVRHHAQGLSLTPAGMELLREVKALLRGAEQLRVAAGALANELTGPLDVGCLLTLAPIIIPEVSYTFEQRHPKVRIRMTEGDQQVLLDRLCTAEISVAITYDLAVPSDMCFEPLAQLPPYAYVAADHPLASRGSVSLRELAPEPLVLLDLPLSRDCFLSLFHDKHLVPNVCKVSSSMEVVRSLVARGYGYSVANFRPVNMTSLDGKPLAYLAIDDDARPLYLGILTLKGVRHTRVAYEFIEHCRALIRNDSIPGMTTLGSRP